jgi:hypothetical protein
MTGKHARPPRQIETSEYVAMMRRIINGYGGRIAADPAALVHAGQLQQDLADAINRGFYAANEGDQHYSQNEMAAMLGVSRQAVAKRIGRGRELHERAAMVVGALVRLADVRAQRAERLEEAGVQDRTGSVRELRARAS